MDGKVTRIMLEKRFGFIRGQDRKEYFFHASALKNCTIEELEVGRDVTFEDAEGEKGPRAEDVYI
jgi:CspA family cold shock protein